MNVSKLAAGVALAGILTFTFVGCGQAASSGDPDDSNDAAQQAPSAQSADAIGSGMSDEDTAEVQEFLDVAQIGRAEAESAALAEVPGQLLGVDADLDIDPDATYEVDVLGDDGQLHSVTVNAQNGNIVSNQTEDSEDTAEAEELLGAAEVSVKRAEETANEQVPGTVVSAGLDEEGGSAVYNIDVFGDDGDLHEVYVDATNGNIIATQNESQNSGDEVED